MQLVQTNSRGGSGTSRRRKRRTLDAAAAVNQQLSSQMSDSTRGSGSWHAVESKKEACTPLWLNYLSACLFQSSHETVIVAVLSARHPSNVIICFWDKKLQDVGFPHYDTIIPLLSSMWLRGGRAEEGRSACRGTGELARRLGRSQRLYLRAAGCDVAAHNDTHGHHSVPGWLQRSAAHRKNPRRLLHDTNSTLKTEVDASALHFRVTTTLRLEVT